MTHVRRGLKAKQRRQLDAYKRLVAQWTLPTLNPPEVKRQRSNELRHAQQAYQKLVKNLQHLTEFRDAKS